MCKRFISRTSGNESCKELQLLVAKLEALQGKLVVARSVSEQQRK
jgi:hypothetical protein